MTNYNTEISLKSLHCNKERDLTLSFCLCIGDILKPRLACWKHTRLAENEQMQKKILGCLFYAINQWLEHSSELKSSLCLIKNRITNISVSWENYTNIRMLNVLQSVAHILFLKLSFFYFWYLWLFCFLFLNKRFKHSLIW